MILILDLAKREKQKHCSILLKKTIVVVFLLYLLFKDPYMRLII